MRFDRFLTKKNIKRYVPCKSIIVSVFREEVGPCGYRTLPPCLCLLSEILPKEDSLYTYTGIIFGKGTKRGISTASCMWLTMYLCSSLINLPCLYRLSLQQNSWVHISKCDAIVSGVGHPQPSTACNCKCKHWNHVLRGYPNFWKPPRRSCDTTCRRVLAIEKALASLMFASIGSIFWRRLVGFLCC